jgi:hypothetical protein
MYRLTLCQAGFRILFIVVLNVIILVIMLSIITLSFIKLSVILPYVGVLSAVVPFSGDKVS